jgi:hypothetical protein
MLPNLIYTVNQNKNSMKKVIHILLILGTCAVHSQVDRTIGSSQYKNTNSSKGEKIDPIERSLLYLKETLNLDAFQEAAVKSYLTENFTESEKANNILTNPEEKRIKFDELKRIFDEKTKSILNPKQIKIFEELKDKNKTKEKKKNKKEEEN